MNNLLAVKLDFETIFYLVFVVAAIVGPLLEARKRKKGVSTEAEESAPAAPKPSAAPETTRTDGGVVEIKLPTGQVIARIPRGPMEQGRPVGPISRPPIGPPASAPITRPAVPAPRPPRRPKRKPRPATPQPEPAREVAALSSYRLAERDLTDLDETRTLGSLERLGAERPRARPAKRRRAAVNLRQALIWSEILQRPIALREPDERFPW